MFLGEDLLPLLVLALGGAMLVGNGAAWLRPRAEVKEGELERPPTGRTVVMMTVGLLASLWALASLLS
ncbi:MAG TPA: hypothetical protein VM030_10160 [Acidimicrobiales bacterium]|nr:hypothetical protein [Acidimicrobiales bacterium]